MASSTACLSLLFRNGVFVSHLQQSVGAFLAEHPSSIYTAARTVQNNRILQYEAHLKRLSHSCRSLFSLSSAPTEELIDAAIRPGIEQGLCRFYEECKQDLEARVVVCIDPVEGLTKETGASSSPELTETAGRSVRFGEKEGTVFVMVAPLLSPSGPTAVEVRLGRRSNPTVKSTKWILDRASFEAKKSKDSNEVVLVDEEGYFYEGLSSNFFAVLDGEVQTASSEHVMLGTIQQMVEKVCEKHDLKVNYARPRLSDVDRWQEVFITSTSRGVLPVQQLRLVEQSPPRTLHYEHSVLSEQLCKWVNDEMLEQSTKIY